VIPRKLASLLLTRLVSGQPLTSKMTPMYALMDYSFYYSILVFSKFLPIILFILPNILFIMPV